jgi:hypothetical protein
MADRDTTSTPYALSFDGLTYFRYPAGDKPRPEVFVTQTGAGTGDGSSLDNAVAIGSLVWASVVPGTIVWVCGTFTDSVFRVDAAGAPGLDVILRGDYPGNPGIVDGPESSYFEFTAENANHITVKNLTINSVVRAGKTAYYNNKNVTFVDAFTLVNHESDWSPYVKEGVVLQITGPEDNGSGKGFEVASASGNTLTIQDTGGWLFTPVGPSTEYSLNFFFKHNHITMDGCLIKPSIPDYQGEIFEMNMGSNITLLNCEMDGGDHVYHGATYNEGRKHATQRSNHHIKGCYVHDIGIPNGLKQDWDNHGFGIQKVDGYLVEECNVERVACGMVLYPGGTDEGENPNQGVSNMVIRYCRFAECDMDRSLTQFPASGIMGSGAKATEAVGTWQYYHNVIVDTVGREATGATFEAVAIATKGDATGSFRVYNNTIYTTPAGNGWNQGLYFPNLIDGGVVRNNIVHGVRQTNAQFAQLHAPSDAAFYSDHNLYSADWASGFRYGGSPVDFAGLQAAGQDANSRVADPMLNEATMRPKAGSEAIGNGGLMAADQRWLGAVTWPKGPGGGSFQYIDLTGAPTIGAFAQEGV